MYFLDLFCGIGGSSYGALSAGLKPKLLVDNDPLVEHVLTQGLKDFYINADLSKPCSNLFHELGNVDVLLSSPPCQSYSRLKHNNRQANPSETDIAFTQAIADSTNINKPKLVIVENVPDFSKSTGGENLQFVLDKFGYKTRMLILNAEEFGVPQRRKRAVLIASKKPISIVPEKENTNVKSAFKGLPEINTTDSLHYYSRKHTAIVMDRIRAIPKDGGSRQALPDELQLECHRRVSGYRDVYGRMSWGLVSPTITGGCTNPSKGRFLHPEENRAITLREAARLQTLPDSVLLQSIRSHEAKARMIGNAFPSLFIQRLIEANL